MGAKTEAIAKQFEAKEAMATLEALSEADWKKVTAADASGSKPLAPPVCARSAMPAG